MTFGALGGFLRTPKNPPGYGPAYFHTWCGLSANLECMSEMCGTRLAENAGPKKVAKNRHMGTMAQLCWAIFLQRAALQALYYSYGNSVCLSVCHTPVLCQNGCTLVT